MPAASLWHCVPPDPPGKKSWIRPWCWVGTGPGFRITAAMFQYQLLHICNCYIYGEIKNLNLNGFSLIYQSSRVESRRVFQLLKVKVPSCTFYGSLGFQCTDNNNNNKTFIYRPIRRPVLRRFTIGTMSKKSKKSEIKQEQDK